MRFGEPILVLIFQASALPLGQAAQIERHNILVAMVVQLVLFPGEAILVAPKEETRACAVVKLHLTGLNEQSLWLCQVGLPLVICET